jgi:hypothetical protein
MRFAEQFFDHLWDDQIDEVCGAPYSWSNSLHLPESTLFLMRIPIHPNQNYRKAAIHIVAFSLSLVIAQSSNVLAMERTLLNLWCGDAGTVTITTRDDLGNGKAYVDVHSSGLQVGAKGLIGEVRPRYLEINMEGYYLLYSDNELTYKFRYISHDARYGGDYKCDPM